MTKIIISKYDKDIDSFISNSSKFNQAKRIIMAYIEKNNKPLSYNAPIYRIPFNMNGSDTESIMRLVGISRNELNKDIKQLPLTRKYPDILKEPFYIVMGMIVRKLNIKLKGSPSNKKNIESDLKLFLLYYSLSFYWSIQYKMFKFEPNENTAQYTINRLNNKFFFKKYNTVSSAILATAEQNNMNAANMLMNGSDDDLIVYSMDLRTRLNNLVKNFAVEIYKDIDAGNYLNSHVDIMDDEENYREGTNVSGTIANISQKVMSEFTQKNIDARILRMSCNMTNTNSNIMRNTLDDIRQNELNKVFNLIQNIITVYIDGKDNPVDSIGGQRFIRESINSFSKSNTKDKRLIENKEILNEFLNKYNDKYNQTEREATKMTYRKTIYFYFVFLIANTY